MPGGYFASTAPDQAEPEHLRPAVPVVGDRRQVGGCSDRRIAAVLADAGTYADLEASAGQS